MNIITTLRTNLHLEKYAVHLSDNEKQYISVLMEKNPEVFAKIQQTMDDIMADGVVDLHDIPKIILLISQMYQANVLVEFIQHIRLLSLVKFTVDCLLDSGLLPIPQVEVVIIKRIVDTTIDLLSTNMDTIQGMVKKTKKCRTWVYWLCCSDFDDDPDNDACGCSRILGCLPKAKPCKCDPCECDDCACCKGKCPCCP